MERIKNLPALRIAPNGEHTINHRAILTLALPLVLNCTIQAVLNLTDTWFIGHLSAAATAALSVITWPAICFMLLFGGVGLAVQTMASQAFGANHKAKAAHYACLGILSAALVAPAFFIVALFGHALFSPFGLPNDVLLLAVEWWKPRIGAGSLSVIFGSLTGFFNATNRTKVTFYLTLLLALVNIPCNYLFLFHYGWGIAGSAWGTNVALFLTCLAGLIIFLSHDYRHQFKTHRVWKPQLSRLKQLMVTGAGVGIMVSVDLLGCSLFQLMQAKLGIIEGAATQIVMSLTSIAYFPTIGMALAGTTLVGQSIGAGSPDWAYKLGNMVIRYILVYMALISALFIAFSSQLSYFFTNPHDPYAPSVTALVTKLLWFAATYQIFDGLNLGSSFCLRGSGDVTVPARLVTCASLLFFAPLSHTLTFNAQQAWIPGLPQLGWGVTGGWIAISIYVCLVGTLLFWRWHSRRWQQLIHLF